MKTKDVAGECSLQLSDILRLSVGEVFVNVSPETITDFLDKSTEGSQRLIQEFQKNLDSIDTQMKELKSSLYARFGSNINLETSMA